jgi:hypothetical protein
MLVVQASSSLCCEQDEEHEDEEEYTSMQESIDNQPLAYRRQQTRAGGVMGKTSPAATAPPTQIDGAGIVSAGGEADHEAACGTADFDSDDMDGDEVGLIPERASASPAQQPTSSGFRGEDWNV